jgi:hypothetical protein
MSGPQLTKYSFRAPQALLSPEHTHIEFLAELKCSYLRSHSDATKFTEGRGIGVWFVSLCDDTCMLLSDTSVAFGLSRLIGSWDGSSFKCGFKFQRDLSCDSILTYKMQPIRNEPRLSVDFTPFLQTLQLPSLWFIFVVWE